MVKKSKPGDWRPYVDYRALNFIAVLDRYPLPHIHGCVSSVHGMAVISTIDLVRAYHQIPVAPEVTPETAITTPFGSFGFLRMPFGLRNDSQTFQRFIDCVLRGRDFYCAYNDFILIKQLAAFQRLKPSLADATTLVYPYPDAQLSLMVDSSKTAIKAITDSLLLSSRKLCNQQNGATAPLDESC